MKAVGVCSKLHATLQKMRAGICPGPPSFPQNSANSRIHPGSDRAVQLDRMFADRAKLRLANLRACRIVKIRDAKLRPLVIPLD